MRILRPLCLLVGCYPDHGCSRCGTCLYDYGFQDGGLLHPVRRLWWRVQNVLRCLIHGHECKNCGKKMRRTNSDYVCSEECRDEWIPF